MLGARPFFLFALVGFFAACGNPAHDDAVDALGPETPGVPQGPLHRPGQPCVTCHGGRGPATMVFSVAGTIYKYQDSLEPLANAVVRLVDSQERRTFTGTNCAGNFFVQPTDYEPEYPLWTSVDFGGIRLDMSTPVFRDGSCAKCHADPPGETAVGHVYFAPAGFDLPGGSCP